MLPFLFVLLLSLQWVAGGDAVQLARQYNSAASSHVLSQLLVLPNPKFALRDNGDGCANGWHVCPNFPNECAPDGSYCCTETGNCPNNTNCFGIDECCPQTAQTCGGQTCCNAGATCCNGNIDCCDSGTFCCNDSFGGCCPDGTSCTAGSNTCSGGVGGGSGGGGGISSPSSPSSSSPSKSSPTTSLVVPTFSPTVVGTSLPTTIGVTPISSASNSSSSTTTSGVPALGGSPHSISMTYIGKTVGLAVVVGIIALGGPVF